MFLYMACIDSVSVDSVVARTHDAAASIVYTANTDKRKSASKPNIQSLHALYRLLYSTLLPLNHVGKSSALRHSASEGNLVQYWVRTHFEVTINTRTAMRCTPPSRQPQHPRKTVSTGRRLRNYGTALIVVAQGSLLVCRCAKAYTYGGDDRNCIPPKTIRHSSYEQSKLLQQRRTRRATSALNPEHPTCTFRDVIRNRDNIFGGSP